MAQQQSSQKQLTSSQAAVAAPIPFLQPRAFAEISEATKDASQPDLQAKIDQASTFGHSLGRINTRPLSHLPIQPKLTIGKVGDPYEQEADRVAAQVVARIHAPASEAAVAMPKLQPKAALRTKAQSQSVQRSEAPEEEEELQMKPLAGSIQRSAAEEEDELQMKPLASSIQRSEVPEEEELQMKPTVQRKSDPGGSAASANLESSISQARGGGQGMSDSIRQPMEQAFGANFSNVRIHNDSQADQLSRSINAQAFTTKNDIFFSRGKYNPSDRGGQELLAHELTHVVQQTGSQIHRKANNLTALPKQAVTSKLIGKTKTEVIQKGIQDYNALPLNDKNYTKQKELLTHIHVSANNWVAAKAGNAKHAHRLAPIFEAGHDAYKERQAVEAQEKSAPYTQNDVGKKRTEGVGDVLSSGGNAVSTTKEARGVYTSFKEILGLLSGGSAKAPEIAKHLEPLHSVGGFLLDLFTGAVSLITGVLSVKGAYDDHQALKTAKKGIDPTSNRKEDINLLEAVTHGAGKVKRRFWSAVYGLVNTIVQVVLRVITFLTGGTAAMVTELVGLGAKALNLITIVLRKAKGIWKAIRGTRGSHREKSAKQLITSAFQGDQTALQLLVALDPIGLIGRTAIIAGREDGLKNMAGSSIKDAASRGWNMAKSFGKSEGDESMKPKNPEEMLKLLNNIKDHPDFYGSLTDFEQKLAAKLKSQA